MATIPRSSVAQPSVLVLRLDPTRCDSDDYAGWPALHRIEIRGGKATSIGRPGRGDDIELPHRHEAYLSARHAVAEYLGCRWTLRCGGSVNGTYVNGIRLTRNSPVPLDEGDRVQFASMHFLVGERPAEA